LTTSTTSAEFFEKMYRESEDPWHFAHSQYEQSRYTSIMAALDNRQYQRTFEPGCSVGELTSRLAKQSTHLDSMDISSTAVEVARKRCSAFSNVSFHVGALPHQIPDHVYDLIVFSEIGYYFDEPSLRELGNMLIGHMHPSGTFLAAHWLGHSEDHVLSGDRVHEILHELGGLRIDHEEHHAGFRLDRWVRL
jgi:trans-aconitate methyltransferase